MKKSELSRLAPPGLALRPELRLFGAGLALAAAGSCSFLLRYGSSRNALYYAAGAKRQLIQGAMMPDFVQLLGRALWGFGALALLCAALAVWHYAYHHVGSKSVYTMRRLPQRWERHRRCLTLPAIGLALSLLCALSLLLIYYAIYMLATPQACLRPGQWQKIWSVIP